MSSPVWVLQDDTLNPDHKSDVGDDGLVAGISVFYEITTISETDRAEFIRRTAPFERITLPEATIPTDTNAWGRHRGENVRSGFVRFWGEPCRWDHLIWESSFLGRIPVVPIQHHRPTWDNAVRECTGFWCTCGVLM